VARASPPVSCRAALEGGTCRAQARLYYDCTTPVRQPTDCPLLILRRGLEFLHFHASAAWVRVRSVS
jgi:hypothetical protein